MTAMLFALGLACLSGPDGEAGRILDGPQRDTVRVEYGRALVDLEAFYTAASGEVLATERRPLSKELPATTTAFRFASLAPDTGRVTTWPVVETSDEHGVAQMVVCRNKSYSFLLRRAAGSAGFSLKSLVKDQKEVAGLMQNNLERYVSAPFSFEFHSIGSLLKQPKFSIRSVAEKVHDGRRALSIDFDCPIDNIRQGGYQGTFVVLPDQKWVLFQYEYWPKKGTALRTGEVEYEGTSGGFPIPKRVTHSILERASRTPHIVTTYDFKSIRFGRLPEKEFTLSAFGLPEIDVVSRPRTGAVEYWLFAAALGALAVAVILWRASARVRRRAAA